MSSEWILPQVLRRIVNSVNPKRENRTVVKEVTLEGLDKTTKHAIIRYLKEKQLNVTDVDEETYAIDLSSLDAERHKDFIAFVESLENHSNDDGVVSESNALASTAVSEVTAYTVHTENMSNFRPFEGIVEVEDVDDEDDGDSPHYIFPRTMHRPEELHFYKPQSFPVDPYLDQKETLEKKKRKWWRRKWNVRENLSKFKLRVYMSVCQCCWPPCFPVCSFIFKKISKFSEWRYKRKMEKVKKEEGFKIYSAILETGNPFQKKETSFVDLGVNTVETHVYNFEGVPISIHDRATITDGPSKRNVAVNTPIFTNNAQNFSILSPEVLSLSNLKQEQRPASAAADKSVDAVAKTSNAAVSTAPSYCSLTRNSDNFFAPNDVRKYFSDPVMEGDLLDDQSTSDGGWGCPCDFFNGICKELSKLTELPPESESSDSGEMSIELKRHQSEILHVKRMLHSAIDVLNKKRM